MRSRSNITTWIGLAILLGCTCRAVFSLPPGDKNVWNYEGGVFLKSDGSIPHGPCFRVSGKLTAPHFFDNLKRVDTDEGAVFRRGNENVTHFPEQMLLTFIVYDMPCSSKLEETSPLVYLTRDLMSTLRLEFYWKHGVELRPLGQVERKGASVTPIVPHAASLAHDLPEKFEWAFQWAIPSAGVPLTDSLVLIIRAPDGYIAARVAARL